MSVRFSIEVFRRLRDRDFRVLNAIERGMASHMYVPVEVIAKLARMDLGEVESLLKRLHSLGLVQRQKGAYVGFILTSRGYDCLALNALVKRGTLESVSSSPIGVGKESEVYAGYTPGNVMVSVKFHRVGRVSFRQTRRRRAYIGDRHHISWLYQSRLAAKSEYEALRILHPGGVSVPRPIDWNRHVVVTGYVSGTELSEVPPLEDPEGVMREIVDNVARAFSLGVVHGDLSEYNIIVTEDGRPVLFDWPQWLSSNHPSAPQTLLRDLRNVAKFFRRKYHLSIDPEMVAREAFERLAGGWS